MEQSPIAIPNGKEHIIPITLETDQPLAHSTEQESTAISSDDDEDLQKAISLSLQGENNSVKEIIQIQPITTDDEELQVK